MRTQWDAHGLPADLTGKSFVDIGCWEGDVCAEAVKRGADFVLGVDYCTSPDLTGNIERSGFSFVQLDVFSEKLLELPEFDVVHCAGVMYHVENPMSLLFRLRKLCRPGAQLFLETSIYCASEATPLMLFHPGATLDDNPSNWWSPNEPCLREMLAAAGFVDIEVADRTAPGDNRIGRIAVTCKAAASAKALSAKMLPRRPSFMPQSGGRGNRVGVTR
ncbi:MAG: class I SAM-dependent methyltransferase [Vulcanimicrobiaceae bacterium]